MRIFQGRSLLFSSVVSDFVQSVRAFSFSLVSPVAPSQEVNFSFLSRDFFSFWVRLRCMCGRPYSLVAMDLFSSLPILIRPIPSEEEPQFSFWSSFFLRLSLGCRDSLLPISFPFRPCSYYNAKEKLPHLLSCRQGWGFVPPLHLRLVIFPPVDLLSAIFDHHERNSVPPSSWKLEGCPLVG